MLSKEELGLYLKRCRDIKDLSLREVDKLTGISYTHLNMIENGKRNVTPALFKNSCQFVWIRLFRFIMKKQGYIDFS